MATCDDFDVLDASLGTRFVVDRQQDVVYVTAGDGTEVQVPGPDLRELLERMRPSAAESSDNPYGAIVNRARERMLEWEHRIDVEERAADEDLSALLCLSGDARWRAIEGERRFQTLSLAGRAFDRSREAVHHDPSLAQELADLGRCVARCLNPQIYGGRQVRSLQALGEAVSGHALRLAGDLRGARRAFQEARALLDLGDPDSHEALEIDDLETILWRDLRDFPRALALNERVIEGNLELGQDDAAAQALQKRASVLDEMGDHAAATDVLRRAARLADGSPNGLLRLTIHHSLTICLARAGRPREAGEVFRSIQGLYRQFSTPDIDARRLWTEGLIALESGDPSAVIEPLTRARTIFENRGYAYDTALVSLDLAAALAALGRTEEVRDLAAATFAFMESREVHPDALAALAVLRQAAAREELDRELLRGLARRLDRASARPPGPVS